MMRVLWLIVLGLLAYLISMVVLFPAAPVVERFKPQLVPVQLDGVSGKLYNGVVRQVRYADDLLPLEFSDVTWQLAPQTLLNGGTGATVGYTGYGGGGRGQVMRRWDGAIAVNDFSFTASAKALEPLLPVPVAQFDGELAGTLDTVLLENQLLTELVGEFSWKNAQLQTQLPLPLQAQLGNVRINVERTGDTTHTATVTASEGEVDVNGTIEIALSGDFTADIVMQPTERVSNATLQGLRQLARPDANGAFRLQQSGNVNRMM